jgi:hypothetical protein
MLAVLQDRDPRFPQPRPADSADLDRCHHTAVIRPQDGEEAATQRAKLLARDVDPKGPCMSQSTATLTLEQWQILFHETMAALLRANEAIKRQFGLWGVLNGLWKSNRDLKALNANLKAISELPDGVFNDELIHSHIPQVRKLLGSIEDLIETGQRHGLTNRSLTSAAFESIRSRGEYIADYLDALEMSIDPEILKAIEEGRNQIQRGEFEGMERLF